MSVTYIAGGLIAASIIFIIQAIRIAYLKKLVREPRVEYVDCSGVDKNPPRFIDVMKNKTINFVVGGEKIVITQINIIKGLDTIQSLARCFKLLKEQIDKNSTNEIIDKRNSLMRWITYKQIINQIYILSKPFAKRKWKYKHTLYNKAVHDFEWTLLLVEQILDYWGYVGELLALLGRGATLRQTHGGLLTWNSITWDTNGKKQVMPRYDRSKS